MPVKIFHKDHGYVITNDQDIIEMLLEKGGEVIVKKPAPEPEIVKPQPPERKANGAR